MGGAEHTMTGSCASGPCSGTAYASSFRRFNAGMKAAVPGFPGFAGIDWDLEGNDAPTSSNNNFSLETYQVMLDMSKELKSEFIISMVPAQSYFDCRSSSFDTSLLHAATSTPSFLYQGANSYTILYAKCPECFDLVMVQLYEGYSLAGFDLFWAGDASHVDQQGWPRYGTEEDMSNVIRSNMKCLVDGWTVDFNGYWDMTSQHVSVPASKVVIGLGSPGWTGTNSHPAFKNPFFSGDASGKAWCDQRVRGFAYWSIHGDGGGDDGSWIGELSSTMQSC